MKHLLIIFSLLAFITPAHAELVSLNCGPTLNLLIDAKAGTYTYNFIAPKNYKYGGNQSYTGRVVVLSSRYKLLSPYNGSKRFGPSIKAIEEYVDRMTGKYYNIETIKFDGSDDIRTTRNDVTQCYKGKAPKPKF